MTSLKNKILNSIENKLMEYKAIKTIEQENHELSLMLNDMKEMEFAYNPEYPNYNTPFPLINFEDIQTFIVHDDLLIAHTPYETYSLNIKSDEYFFEFIKNLIVVGEKILIGKERLLMNHEYYNFNIDLTNEVDVVKIRQLVYCYHTLPKKKLTETIVSNRIIDDFSYEEALSRVINRYGGHVKYEYGNITFNKEGVNHGSI